MAACKLSFVRHIGRNRDRVVPGKLRRLLPRRRIDIGNRHTRTFAREQDRRGAANAGTRRR